MIPIITVLKLLRIAMGYGSRTERITRMLNSPDPATSMTARGLMASGCINREDGTIVVNQQ